MAKVERDMKDLARQIENFLGQHAKISADYDPQYDSYDDRWNGPDSAMLYIASRNLAKGEKPRQAVHSTYGSGCYRPYPDKDAETLHDDLVKRANAYVSADIPKPKWR